MEKKNTRKSKHILSYFAVFDPIPEGGYTVSFPNFPGCVTFGKNFEEAKKMAHEVLELWLEELTSQREKIYTTDTRPIIDEIIVKAPLRATVCTPSMRNN